MDITGRKLFVKALEEEGVDTIFAYPGGTSGAGNLLALFPQTGRSVCISR